MRLSDAEWEIMNALWEHHPATTREVSENLEGNHRAYTTIKTMLTRLAAKGAVGERKRGNVSVYEPLVSKRKARRAAMRSLIDRAFGGAVEPMLNFMVKDKGLSDKQRRELIRMLEEEDRDRGELE